MYRSSPVAMASLMYWTITKRILRCCMRIIYGTSIFSVHSAWRTTSLLPCNQRIRLFIHIKETFRAYLHLSCMRLGHEALRVKIWITTFTVGIASLLLAKTFFTRVAGDLFATIIVLILMTDYLLFAQWQVNIYRVWHGFFLFASLVCAHELGDWSRRKWAIATVCLYACLLYWEAYICILCRGDSRCIHGVDLPSYAPPNFDCRIYAINRRCNWFGNPDNAGCAVSRVAGFSVDLKSTYGARNFGDDPLVAVEKLKQFYDSRNITFWYNIQSDVNFRGLMPFLRSIFANVLQILNPLLHSCYVGSCGRCICCRCAPPQCKRHCGCGPICFCACDCRTRRGSVFLFGNSTVQLRCIWPIFRDIF